MLRKLWTLSPEKVYWFINRKLHAPKEEPEPRSEIHEIKTGLASGVKLVLNTDQFNEIKNGSYELFLLETIKKFIKPGEIILDIGAHFGFISLCMAKLVDDKGRIFSVEPNPNNTKAFLKNMEINLPLSKKITLVEGCIADKKGKLEIKISRHQNDPTAMGGFLSGVVPPLDSKVYQDFIPVTVQAFTIDDLVNEYSIQPGIIKIDVEGAEFLALRGGKNYLDKNKPDLLIEIHSVAMMHHCLGLLNEMGYKTTVLNEEQAKPNCCIILAN